MSDRERAVHALAARLGHDFADPDLLDRALTHASVGDGAKKVANNERLEFLGDRVLGLIVADALMRRYPEDREGDLAKRFNGLVDRKTCAEVARAWGVGPALRLPGGETRRGARDQDVFLADACEAVIAALYLDAGVETARAVVMDAWAERIDAASLERSANAKMQLQEWALGHRRPLPRYAVVARTGADHAPTFRVRVEVEGLDAAEGEGGSRQAAETAAAQTALQSALQGAAA